MDCYHKDKDGFTLIELLVVISVLGLLISIMLPTLNRAKRLSDRIICLSNERQCAMICTVYADENQDWLPQGNVNPKESMPEYWTETNFSSCVAMHEIYGIEKEIGMCQSWMKQIDDFFYEPEMAEEGFYLGGTSIGFIYFGRRYDQPNTPMSPILADGKTYRSLRKTSDSVHLATSNTLFVCYHWDSISSQGGWGAKIPHLQHKQARYLRPGYANLPAVEGLAVGYLDTSAGWVNWDELAWFEQNRNIRTYFSPRS